ncbi:MAG: FtsW/RodA/SpoVE family cell cycle protein, partial [Ilumatobacteraceae bacterium]
MARPISISRRRRNSELTMIVMVALITGGGYTLAALGTNSEIPARVVPFVVAVVGLLVAAHIGVRILARGADSTLLPLAAFLHGIGYVMITRIDEDLAALQT